MSKMISVSQALEIMNRKDVRGEPIPCDIDVRTFNRQSKKGGKLKKYRSVILLPLSYSPEFKRQTLESIADAETPEKNPNHFENKTRNIKNADGDINKINLNFLIKVNGNLVRY